MPYALNHNPNALNPTYALCPKPQFRCLKPHLCPMPYALNHNYNALDPTYVLCPKP